MTSATKLFALLLVAFVVSGCAGHSARTKKVRAALDFNDPKAALAAINDELGVDSAKDLPKKTSGDNALLLLDRAMILQALHEYELSTRDLETADKQVEILDLSRNAVDEIGKYMFSDDSGPYRAPPYEKLLINTMGMLNYLVREDLNGARIEARRLAVMQKFIKETEDPAVHLNGPASYLAGFTFEKSGRPQEALRYYDEALQYDEYRTLVEPIRRLAKKATYRSPRILKILREGAAPEPAPEGKHATPPPDAPLPEPTDGGPSIKKMPPVDSAKDTAPPTTPPDDPDAPSKRAQNTVEQEDAPTPPVKDDRGEILVIVNFGRVPAKKAKRIPIGLALTFAADAIAPTNAARANRLAAQGLVTWVNYPELGKPRGQWGVPGYALDGDWQNIEGALALDREARRAWDHAKGPVIAAAITRLVTRLVAGQVAKKASGGGLLGTLLSLGTQATLTAADTPDTRSWSTLPARIAVARTLVSPGTHWVDIKVRGVHKRQRVVIRPNGWAVVNLTVLS